MPHYPYFFQQQYYMVRLYNNKVCLPRWGMAETLLRRRFVSLRAGSRFDVDQEVAVTIRTGQPEEEGGVVRDDDLRLLIHKLPDLLHIEITDSESEWLHAKRAGTPIQPATDQLSFVRLEQHTTLGQLHDLTDLLTLTRMAVERTSRDQHAHRKETSHQTKHRLLHASSLYSRLDYLATIFTRSLRAAYSGFER